jgi:2-polyprenyl-6-methoxyphenol hydroxylase-like FAD-dependent oxidoreductase
MTTDVDAVIAGGGVAGSAAAAALAALGWSVLIVEPGQHDERRLAGELIHPSGVDRLAELGLLAAPAFASAARLDGFAIFTEAGRSDCIELPYARAGGSPALALDHASICASLLVSASALPAVTVARGCRVTSLEGTPGNPIVRMRRESISCRLVVAADGASSPVRGYAGLGHQRERNAVLTGCLVDQDALPLRGRGHIFTASGGPVLAYAIGNARARVLFNGPLRRGNVDRTADAKTEALTPRLRAAVEAAMAGGSGQSFVSSDVTVSGVTRGDVVLVGDAAGTCHPISASGMTMGIDDATRLARALRGRDGDVPAALALYAAERRSRQRARVLLAAMLRDALGGAGPEMGLLRSELQRYWSGSVRARAASMALLGMDDVSMRSILYEFARVMASGVFASFGEPASVLRRVELMARLSRPMIGNVIGAMRVQ